MLRPVLDLRELNQSVHLEQNVSDGDVVLQPPPSVMRRLVHLYWSKGHLFSFSNLLYLQILSWVHSRTGPLPLCVTTVPCVFTRCIVLIVAFFWTKGIVVSQHIDDWHLMADSWPCLLHYIHFTPPSHSRPLGQQGEMHPHAFHTLMPASIYAQHKPSSQETEPCKMFIWCFPLSSLSSAYWDWWLPLQQ